MPHSAMRLVYGYALRTVRAARHDGHSLDAILHQFDTATDAALNAHQTETEGRVLAGPDTIRATIRSVVLSAAAAA